MGCPRLPQNGGATSCEGCLPKHLRDGCDAPFKADTKRKRRGGSMKPKRSERSEG